jgi:hypothetical protein
MTMSYYYSELCSHLGDLIIDFLVPKDIISFSDSWGLSALNMQKHFWIVSSCEHVNFAINGKYSKKIMTIQTIMFHLWSFKHTKIEF